METTQCCRRQRLCLEACENATTACDHAIWNGPKSAVTICYIEFKTPVTGCLDSSEVFQSHWFGRVNEKANTVVEGLWAHTEVDTEAWGYTHNSYGLLRAPWNNLHSKYLRLIQFVDSAV